MAVKRRSAMDQKSCSTIVWRLGKPFLRTTNRRFNCQLEENTKISTCCPNPCTYNVIQERLYRSLQEEEGFNDAKQRPSPCLYPTVRLPKPKRPKTAITARVPLARKRPGQRLRARRRKHPKDNQLLLKPLSRVTLDPRTDLPIDRNPQPPRHQIKDLQAHRGGQDDPSQRAEHEDQSKQRHGGLPAPY